MKWAQLTISMLLSVLWLLAVVVCWNQLSNWWTVAGTLGAILNAVAGFLIREEKNANH